MLPEFFSKSVRFIYLLLKIVIARISRGKLFYEDLFSYLTKYSKDKDNKSLWEELTPIYISHYKNPPDKKFLEIINAHIFSKNTKILEYGCSAGMNLNYLNKLKGLTNLYGVDISEKAIRVGKVRYHNINFLLGDLANPSQNLINKLDENFEIVYTRAVLQHINNKDLNRILKIFNKIMKQKAYLILSECNRSDIPYGLIKGHRVYNTYNHNWEEILPLHGFIIKNKTKSNYIIASKL